MCRYKEFLFPVMLGVVAFLLIFGYHPLDPTFVSWISSGDLAQHYLGWLFFRKADWTFPIGQVQELGLELSSAVVYCDVNLLVSFIFKFCDPLLPNTFQYMGIWFLSCYILQGIFSYKLLRLFTQDKVIAYLGVCFFLFFPPFVGRWGHANLCAHWIIIAAWYYFFIDKQYNRILIWVSLLSFSVLTHAYFLLMVGAIWFANMLSEYMKRQRTLRQLIFETVIVFVLLSLLMYSFGYFTSSGITGKGFGFYKMNVLSLLDPSGWSYILKDIPNARGEYEGFQFLGLGVLLLLMIAALGIDFERIKNVRNRMSIWFPLALLIIFIFLFSVTNVVGVGDKEYIFPIPRWLEHICGIFRASGRLFWVVSYLIIVLGIVQVSRRYPRQKVLIVLSLCFCIQFMDSSSAWGRFRGAFKNSPNFFEQTEFINDKIWSELAKHYDNIRVIPIEGIGICKMWKEIGYFAVKNGLGTDCIYFARTNPEMCDHLKAKNDLIVKTTNFDPKSITIVSKEIAQLLHEKGEQRLYKIGNYFVVLGETPLNFRLVPVQDKDLYPVIDLGKEYKLTENKRFGLRQILSSGWHDDKANFCWSKGTESKITFLLDKKQEKPNEVIIDGIPLIGDSVNEQKVDVYLNGFLVKKLFLNREEKIIIPLQRHLLVDKNVLLLKYHNASRPVDLGINGDQRMLALGVRSILFK